MDYSTFVQGLSEDHKKPSAGFGIIRRILRYLPPHASSLVLANLCMLVGAAASLIVPYLMGRFFDANAFKEGWSELNRIVLLIFGALLVSTAASYGQSYFAGRAGSRIIRQLKFDVFSHLLKLDVAFYETRSTGELVSRLNSDLSTIQTYIISIVPTVVGGICQFGGSLTILFWLQPKLAGFNLLVLFLPILLSTRAIGRFRRLLATQQQDAQAYASSVAEETFNGIRTVKALGRETHEGNRYKKGLDQLLALQIRFVKIGSALDALSSIITWVGMIVFLWYGGGLMLNGKLSPGQLASFLFYGNVCYKAAGSLVGLYVGYQGAVGAGLRVFHIMDLPFRRASGAPAIGCSSRFDGKISFNTVSFAYPQARGRLALDKVTFQVEPGETVGIVGPSGAGKSTIFLLLMGFYEVAEGSIQIDDAELDAIPVAQLRQNLAVVPQDIFMFSGTVEENIQYGRLEASPEEIRAAARGSGAHEFIERFPRGYAELVGARGIKLSAGQRQRIAIARAFLMNPSILLLDEATSSLDPDSEELVREALLTLMRDRTTLVIAHRLATARRADRILVVEEGRIVTSGTHDFLYSHNALYRRYWDLQAFASERKEPAVPRTSCS